MLSNTATHHFSFNRFLFVLFHVMVLQDSNMRSSTTFHCSITLSVCMSWTMLQTGACQFSTTLSFAWRQVGATAASLARRLHCSYPPHVASSRIYSPAASRIRTITSTPPGATYYYTYARFIPRLAQHNVSHSVYVVHLECPMAMDVTSSGRVCDTSAVPSKYHQRARSTRTEMRPLTNREWQRWGDKIITCVFHGRRVA
jgi:hypothetical protein